MAELKDILGGLDGLGPGHQQRIEEVLRLMNRQSLGAERLRGNVRAITKEDRSPVTIADLLHQTQLQFLLMEHFPDDAIICEEPRALQEQVVEEAAHASRLFYDMPLPAELPQVEQHGDFTWIYDPIDGTKGYLAGRYYAIAAGYFHLGEPLFAAMAVPARPPELELRIGGRLAFAIKGRGAWIGEVSEEGRLRFEPLRTEAASLPDPVRVAISLEHGSTGDRLAGVGNVKPVRLDSQAKYLAVACGELDIYMRNRRDDGHPDVIWDHLPGALIAMEAGCACRQFDGRPLVLEPKRVIEFSGGFACYRGQPDGPLGELVGRLIG